jgi:hypothetical protein
VASADSVMGQMTKFVMLSHFKWVSNYNSITDDIVTSPAKRLFKGDIVVVTTRVREPMIRPETIRHNDIIVDLNCTSFPFSFAVSFQE